MDSPEIPSPHESSPDTEMDTVYDLVDKLKDLEPRDDSERSSQVDTALEITREVLAPHKDWLVHNKIVPTIHGSLLYHKPKNLDIDLTFFYTDPPSDPENDYHLLDVVITTELESKQNPLHPEQHLNTDFGVVTPIELDEQLKLVESGEVSPDDEDHIAAHSVSQLSQIITSDALYAEQIGDFERLRKQAFDRLAISPVLRAAIISDLQGVLEDQRERRKE